MIVIWDATTEIANCIYRHSGCYAGIDLKSGCCGNDLVSTLIRNRDATKRKQDARLSEIRMLRRRHPPTFIRNQDATSVFIIIRDSAGGSSRRIYHHSGCRHGRFQAAFIVIGDTVLNVSAPHLSSIRMLPAQISQNSSKGGNKRRANTPGSGESKWALARPAPTTGQRARPQTGGIIS